MICARKGCLASFQWFGTGDDEALRALAEENGWRLLEGSGWTCPRHMQADAPKGGSHE